MPEGCEILPKGASDPAFAQPARVEVTEEVGAATVFSLFYDLRIDAGDLPLLTEPQLGPEAELAIRVRAGSGQAVLVRGPVTGQRIVLAAGAAGSVVEVMGADVTLALGRESKVRVWPTTTDAGVISELLGGAGLAPVVSLPTTVTHTDTKNALVQRETDLHLIRRLARRNGCWLWLEYDPESAEPMAYVERPPVDADAAVQLHLEGDERNVEQVQIEWNIERVVAADSDARDSFAASDMSGTVERSPLTPQATHALADITSTPRRARLSAAVDDAGDLMVRSEAALIEAAWFVRATVSVRERVLKAVVRSPGVVELHGAGSRHSGRYLVTRVVHHIDDGDHRMDLTLVRNAWN